MKQKSPKNERERGKQTEQPWPAALSALLQPDPAKYTPLSSGRPTAAERERGERAERGASSRYQPSCPPPCIMPRSQPPHPPRKLRHFDGGPWLYELCLQTPLAPWQRRASVQRTRKPSARGPCPSWGLEDCEGLYREAGGRPVRANESNWCLKVLAGLIASVCSLGFQSR